LNCNISIQIIYNDQTRVLETNANVNWKKSRKFNFVDSPTSAHIISVWLSRGENILKTNYTPYTIVLVVNRFQNFQKKGSSINADKAHTKMISCGIWIIDPFHYPAPALSEACEDGPRSSILS
jgi:hypothetical protein